MRYLLPAFLSLICTLSFSAELIRHPDHNMPFPQRMQWAIESANRQKISWLGYSIQRYMGVQEIFLSGVSINGMFKLKNSKPSLKEWITGAPARHPRDEKKAAESELKRLENGAENKVWKDIGVFLRFQNGSKIPDRIQVIDLTISSSFDGPMYWIGSATHEESFRYLSGLYHQALSKNSKEDLMPAMGIHPPQIAFPFMKQILNGSEPEGAQEAAAIVVGEFDTHEALALLREVARDHRSENVRESAVVAIAEIRLKEAAKTLEEIAWFGSDSEIRQTAVVMLADRKEGVPILIRIMEDHPSADTRETALQMLAETVAGREVLKKKVKQ